MSDFSKGVRVSDEVESLELLAASCAATAASIHHIVIGIIIASILQRRAIASIAYFYTQTPYTALSNSNVMRAWYLSNSAQGECKLLGELRWRWKGRAVSFVCRPYMPFQLVYTVRINTGNVQGPRADIPGRVKLLLHPGKLHLCFRSP